MYKKKTLDIFISFEEILSKSYDLTRQNFIFPSLSRSVDENFRKFLTDDVLDSLSFIDLWLDSDVKNFIR